MTFYSFLIKTGEDQPVIDGINAKSTWYRFENETTIDVIPQVKQEFGKQLIFGSTRIEIEESRFSLGLMFNLESYYFENHLVNEIEEDLPESTFPNKLEFKREENERFVSSLNMIRFANLTNPNNLKMFDEINDDPQEWIQNVEQAISGVNGDLDQHGKHVLFLLFDSQTLKW